MSIQVDLWIERFDYGGQLNAFEVAAQQWFSGCWDFMELVRCLAERGHEEATSRNLEL